MPADTGGMHSSIHSPRTPSTEDQRKVDQQKQLDTLRKRLLAKRATSQRPETPSKTPAGSEPPQAQNTIEPQENDKKNNQANKQANDDFGIESLLAEGKAAAEAKVARDNQVAAALAASMNAPETVDQLPAASSQPANTIAQEAQHAFPHAKQAKSSLLDSTPPPKPTDSNPNNITAKTHPVNLSDPYYDDLAIWLEYSGYHDVEHRSHCLSTFKQRRDLEEQAARIAHQLEQLNRIDKAKIDSFRASSSHPTAATPMAPPPLPQFMPGEHRTNTNGVKRPYSPEEMHFERSNRRVTDFGYRIRGANEAIGGLPRDNGSPLERRESFSDRRRSFDDRHERDSSLERRQHNYKRDVGPRGNGVGRNAPHNQWIPARDGPRPFNAREREQREGRAGFSAVNRIFGPVPHSGNSSLDLRKGGQSYSRYHD